MILEVTRGDDAEVAGQQQRVDGKLVAMKYIKSDKKQNSCIGFENKVIDLT
jgi:hypothetical protein